MGWRYPAGQWVGPEGDRTLIEGKVKWNGSEQGQLLLIEIVVARFFLHAQQIVEE